MNVGNNGSEVSCNVIFQRTAMRYGMANKNLKHHRLWFWILWIRLQGFQRTGAERGPPGHAAVPAAKRPPVASESQRDAGEPRGDAPRVRLWSS